MSIDYKQSPDEILVALINAENDTSFTTNELDLHSLAIAPDPVSGRETFNNVRTSLRVDAVPGSGYANGVDITYNRINLRDVFPNNDPPGVRYPNSTDEGYLIGERSYLADLLADINTKYGINLQATDIFDLSLPVFSGPPPYEPAYVRLEIKAGHKVFIGGVNLRILPNDWDLNNIQFVELDGLVYPLNGVVIPQSWTDINTQMTNLASSGGFNYTPH